MTNAELLALLREAREALIDPEAVITCNCTNCILGARIDAALAEASQEGRTTCEFCKGRGSVPAKKAWSPKAVLGPDDGR